MSTEMSGICFDLPGVRLLTRFSFEAMMRTFASFLCRWFNAPACGSRQVYFRYDEAELSAASQSACKLINRTLSDSRAADGALAVSKALYLFNNWTKPKDQHELLFIRETLPPVARGPTQRQLRSFSGPTTSNKDSKEDILAARGRVFRKRRSDEEKNIDYAERDAAFALGTQT